MDNITPATVAATVGTEIREYDPMRENVKDAIYAMQAGEVMQFPAAKIQQLRAYCSNYGAAWGRRYKTRTDRANHIVLVTRLE